MLTFKRANHRLAHFLNIKKPWIHVKDHDHVLLKYTKRSDTAAGSFSPVGAGNEIDFKVKTLFLIHGTGSNTAAAFKGLIEVPPGETESWLDLQFSKYGQIIGFDHPTFTEDAAMNVTRLIEMLGGSFTGEVDIITHSRGGLVGKYIAINTPQIPVAKGVLVACANGVGYFTAGWRVAKFLSVLKTYAKLTGSEMTYFIAALAQYSAEYFLTMPGPQLMTPGNPRLLAIAAVAPAETGHTRYKPIVGGFNKSLVQDAPIWKRWGEIGLDGVIKLFLGSDNDWVVGSKEQFILFPASYYAGHYDATQYKSVMIPGYHTTYFDGVTSPQVIPDLNMFL